VALDQATRAAREQPLPPLAVQSFAVRSNELSRVLQVKAVNPG